MTRESPSAWLSSLALIVVMIGTAPAATGAEEAGGSESDGGQLGIVVALNPAAGDVSAGMVEAMQRDLKITAAQARARLVRSDWASRLDPLLRLRLGKAFAGSWLAEDGHDFVVAITDRRLERLVRASGATAKLVARNEAQLAALSARLEAVASRPGMMADSVTGWVTDPQSNGIRVQHLPGGRAAAEALAAAAALAAGEVSFEQEQSETVEVRDLRAGSEYLSAGGLCTVGLAVFWPNLPGVLSRSGFLTAGHCGGVASNARIRDPITPRFMGVVAASIDDSGEHDEAVVITEPGYFPVPRVTKWAHGVVDVEDGVQQVDGSPVCTSGATTAWRCGTIRPGLHSVPGHYRNLKAHNICNLSGDSGGPVMSGTHAQGITSRGYDISSGCPWFRFNTYGHYVPLQRALSHLGAELKVKPVEVAPPTPSPSSKWTSGNKLWGGIGGGAIQGKVASASLATNHLQVFGRGSDNLLYTNTSTDGRWGNWQGLGDFMTEPPAVLARSGGIDVYYRGGDTKAYLRRFNGSGWEPALRLGNLDVQGQIFALSPQPGHVSLFARGSNDEVYFNFTDGVAPWSGWSSLGGDTNAAPTAIARTNAAGQIVLEVYARWADDNVRYRRLDPAGPPGWQPWVNLGGIWKDTPVGVTVGPNQSWLVGWSSDNTAHVQRFKDGSWLPAWRGLGGQVESPLTAVAEPGERFRVFARDAGQQINTITWRGGDVLNFEPWTTLDGATSVPVGVAVRTVADQKMVIDAFGIDSATRQPFHTMLDAGLPVALAAGGAGATVGNPAAFTVNGPPGAPVSWSATQDGVVREDHAFYGHHLDNNGEFTWDVGDLPASATGSWVRQAHVGTQNPQTTQVAYTVAHRPVTVSTDKAEYQVGENITYAVTGPVNQPIRWTSTINGQPSGETDAYYGQTTDANGVFTVTVPWTDHRGGTWTKQVTVAGQTAQAAFTVAAPPVSAPRSDFDGDGRTDLAITGPPDWNSLPVAMSQGDGTFAVTNLPNDPLPTWAATPGAKVLTGDFNGDGKTDLAITGPAGWTTVPVAMSWGGGTFVITNFPSQVATWAATPGAKVITGDFNGDGKTDLTITGPADWNSLPVAMSQGDGTFAVTNLPNDPIPTWAATPGAMVLGPSNAL